MGLVSCAHSVIRSACVSCCEQCVVHSCQTSSLERHGGFYSSPRTALCGLSKTPEWSLNRPGAWVGSLTYVSACHVCVCVCVCVCASAAQSRTRRVPTALQDYQVEAVTGGTPEPANATHNAAPAGRHLLLFFKSSRLCLLVVVLLCQCTVCSTRHWLSQHARFFTSTPCCALQCIA
jgi:hypothetical protein